MPGRYARLHLEALELRAAPGDSVLGMMSLAALLGDWRDVGFDPSTRDPLFRDSEPGGKGHRTAVFESRQLTGILTAGADDEVSALVAMSGGTTSTELPVKAAHSAGRGLGGLERDLLDDLLWPRAKDPFGDLGPSPGRERSATFDVDPGPLLWGAGGSVSGVSAPGGMSRSSLATGGGSIDALPPRPHGEITPLRLPSTSEIWAGGGFGPDDCGDWGGEEPPPDGGAYLDDWPASTPNNPPIAVDDPNLETDEDTPIEIDVLANDGDPDPGDMAWMIVDVDPMSSLGVITNYQTFLMYDPNGALDYLELGETATETFQYSIVDTFGELATATVSVAVAGRNKPPVATDDYGTTNEGAPVTLNVLTNDRDPDRRDTLSIQTVDAPGIQGAVRIEGNSLVYDPNGNLEHLGWNQSARETFRYTIADRQGATATAKVTVTVDGINDPPTACEDGAPVPVSLMEDSSATIPVLTNDRDPDGDALIVTAVTNGGHGKVTFTRTRVTYTPNPDSNGADEFTYTINDGRGGTSMAPVHVTVQAVDDLPQARPDYGTCSEGGSVTVSILTNDSDVEGPITLVSVDTTSQNGGTVQNNGNGTVTYRPQFSSGGSGGSGGQGFSGFDSFTYRIKDNTNQQATGNVTVYVTDNHADDPPWVRGNQATTDEDQAVTFNVLANDSDAEGPVTLVSLGSPQVPGATVVHIGNGNVTYTPAPNYFGSDGFTYMARDTYGHTASGGAQVTIRPINDLPVAQENPALAGQNHQAFALPDAAVTIYVLGNDSDADNDELIVTAVEAASRGTTWFNGDSVVYMANFNATGTDRFRYQVKDGHGGSALAYVDVTIVTVNNFLRERERAPNDWVSVEENVCWSHDKLRWGIRQSDVSQFDPPQITGVSWLKKPQPELWNRGVDWVTFATGGYPASQGGGSGGSGGSGGGSGGSSGGGIPASPYPEANPLVGNWVITPEVQFSVSAPYAQSPFKATTDAPRWIVDAEIVSVAWEGIYLGGQVNLANDNPPDMGGGWRFFYGRNFFPRTTPPLLSQIHQKVQVVAQVRPNVPGIPVRLRVVDADDPTDRDGPIDNDLVATNLTDNRTATDWDNVATQTVAVAGAQTSEVRLDLMTCMNPGDNFRVIAGAGNRGGEMLIKPMFFGEPAPLGETQGRLFVDDAVNDNQRGANEAILTEAEAVRAADNRFLSTPLLTVWRRLYVEVDSMGAPMGPNALYGFSANQPVDDPRPGNIADPDIGAFAAAFRPAFIDVPPMPAGPRPGPGDSTLPRAWNQTNLPLGRNFPVIGSSMDTYFLHQTQGARQTMGEDNDYWTVYVAGVYEMFPQAGHQMSPTDNDPNNEYATLGFTETVREPEYSLVGMEIIRDVAAQHTWNPQQIAAFQRVVALHEVGHQFGLALPHHPPGFGNHVMQIHANDEGEAQLHSGATTFRDEDIVEIRRHGGGRTGSTPNPLRP